MLPFILLWVFLGSAFVAVAFFIYLTSKDPVARRDDWKKFLSGFAGTALALSVGFISLMLQQDDRTKQRQLEENGQIKARLTYSLAQKKFEASLLADVLGEQKRSDKICKAASLEDGNRNFEDWKQDTKVNFERKFARDIFERLFAGSALQRDTMNRLLRETSLSLRLDQTMVLEIMDLELRIQVGSPALLGRHVDGPPVSDQVSFCRTLDHLYREADSLVREINTLQVYTCGVFSTVDVDAAESAKRLRTIVAEIEEVRKSGLATEVRGERLRLGLPRLAGLAFENCAAFAGLDFAGL